ncbi:MAG: peroxide stress protein YaaA [Paludibacter sp.]|nr:peroxide stress protein YaaA [Paludibacter sp.]
MLLLLSPAKIQNFTPQHYIQDFTIPEFIDSAGILAHKIKQLSRTELADLLDINSNLAQLNADRHFNWQVPFTPQNAKQSIFVFNGEVFRGLDAKTFSPDEFGYLQSHLRILSGLYGVLRPLDLIQPYRLEVSTRLKTDKGNNLYAFWKNHITPSLNNAILGSGGPKVLLNLASGEYFKSINRKQLQAEVIDFEFLENRNDQYIPIVMYVKKARGMFVRYVIEHRIENVEDLKGFNADGYWYNSRLSTEKKLVFTRG